MKHKLLSLLLCFLLFTSLIPNACAAEDHAVILDNAGLLSPEEITSLEILTQSMQEAYQMDIVILTVEVTGYQSIQNYADTFYDENGYSDNGILFLLALKEREWYISTCGEAIYAVTDYGVQRLGQTAVAYFSEDNYYDGFSAFLTELAGYLDAYQSSTPVDGYADYSGDFYHGDQEDVVYYGENNSSSFLVSLIIGLIAATITIAIMRASMNTKRSQRTASAYMLIKF